MAITVPVIGSEISATDFGIPVANNVNMLFAPFTTGTLVTSGLSVASSNLRYRQLGWEVTVYIKIVLSGGSMTNPIVNLPIGASSLTNVFVSGLYLQSGARWWNASGINSGAGIAPLTFDGGFVNSTTPFAWGVNCEMHFRVQYMSAAGNGA